MPADIALLALLSRARVPELVPVFEAHELFDLGALRSVTSGELEEVVPSAASRELILRELAMETEHAIPVSPPGRPPLQRSRDRESINNLSSPLPKIAQSNSAHGLQSLVPTSEITEGTGLSPTRPTRPRLARQGRNLEIESATPTSRTVSEPFAENSAPPPPPGGTRPGSGGSSGSEVRVSVASSSKEGAPGKHPHAPRRTSHDSSGRRPNPPIGRTPSWVRTHPLENANSAQQKAHPPPLPRWGERGSSRGDTREASGSGGDGPLARGDADTAALRAELQRAEDRAAASAARADALTRQAQEVASRAVRIATGLVASSRTLAERAKASASPGAADMAILTEILQTTDTASTQLRNLSASLPNGVAEEVVQLLGRERTGSVISPGLLSASAHDLPVNSRLASVRRVPEPTPGECVNRSPGDMQELLLSRLVRRVATPWLPSPAGDDITTPDIGNDPMALTAAAAPFAAALLTDRWGTAPSENTIEEVAAKAAGLVTSSAAAAAAAQRPLFASGRFVHAEACVGQELRLPREDRWLLVPSFGSLLDPQQREGSDEVLAAVFDGHDGHAAANFCRDHFMPVLLRHIRESKDRCRALQKTVAELDARFNSIANETHTPAGACITAALCSNQMIRICHLGDSRAVLGKKQGNKPPSATVMDVDWVSLSAEERKSQLGVYGYGCKALTTDHVPSNPVESAAVVSRGGEVIDAYGCKRVQGQLAVTRALGDSKVRKFVSQEPEILEIPRTPDMSFLVLATDGLWGVMSDEEAVAYVSEMREDVDSRRSRLLPTFRPAECSTRSRSSIDYSPLQRPRPPGQSPGRPSLASLGPRTPVQGDEGMPETPESSTADSLSDCDYATIAQALASIAAEDRNQRDDITCALLVFHNAD
eukprot:Hpha_TRINITY_DN16238_c0_g11::TRINITY_DN16238_c0_g11_i1::g.14797::m.14797